MLEGEEEFDKVTKLLKCRGEDVPNVAKRMIRELEEMKQELIKRDLVL